MDYNSLTQLLSESSDSRSFFLNLPVDIQLELHKYNDSIRTSADLKKKAETLGAKGSYDARFPHEYFVY